MSRLTVSRCAVFGIVLFALAALQPASAATQSNDPQLEGQAAIDYLVQTGQYDSFLTALAGATEPDAVSPAEQKAASIAQFAYLKAPNTGAGDYFGEALALSGDTAVVGANGEGSGATGVNGNQNDNTATGSGAAYVLTRSGSTWTVEAYLKASNTGAGDRFGLSVAISGNTIVVGARYEASGSTGVNGNQSDNSAANAGAAYVFVRSGTTWSQQAYLKASNSDANDEFGAAVAIAGDTIVVGARGEDSAATGVNGNQDDNSAMQSGAAYVFVRNGTSWSQQAYVKASNTDANDLFGSSVGISGGTLVVGAWLEDSAATGANGSQSDNSAPEAGASYVFVRSGTTWSQQAFLKASNTAALDHFGHSVAISGDTIVVGAYGEDSAATGINGNQSDNSALEAGAAYVFVRAGASWSQQAYLKASTAIAGGNFGSAVSVVGSTALVGALRVGASQSQGAAYAFLRTGTSWAPLATLAASNAEAGDYFGVAVAVAGDMMLVGAVGESSAATGVNGNQSDNSANSAGAAYAFLGTSPPPAGDWLQTPALPGFRFKVLIDGNRIGTQVADCVPETLCIAGAIPTRAELFVRIIGPRPNGKLWAQTVRFTVARVELWIEQISTGKVNYYLLESLPAATETLPGINDSLAFEP